MNRLVAHVYDQSYKLIEALQEKGVTHNQIVWANIDNLQGEEFVEQRQVIFNNNSKEFVSPLYFCNMKLEILKTIQEGDGKVIPDEVKLTNFFISRPGFFSVRKVKVFINSAVHVEFVHGVSDLLLSVVPCDPL